MRPQTDPLYGRSFTLDNCASFSVVRQPGGDDQVKRRCLRSILSLTTSFASLLDTFKFEKLLMYGNDLSNGVATICSWKNL